MIAMLLDRLRFGPRPPVPKTIRECADVYDWEVNACACVLSREVSQLVQRFSVPALGTALTMHANAALAACVERREITEEQARQLVLQFAEVAFTRGDFRKALIAQASLYAKSPP